MSTVNTWSASLCSHFYFCSQLGEKGDCCPALGRLIFKQLEVVAFSNSDWDASHEFILYLTGHGTC